MSEKTVYIDAMSGTDCAQLCISQFTHNFDTVKFHITDELLDYTIVIVAEISGIPTIFETDGTQLYTEYDETSEQTFLVWHPGREVTCTDGLVTYQIAAYKTENDEVVSTWYSKEGRIIVADSIDTTSYSTELIGSHPNLVTKLILETDKVRTLVNLLELSKVDKADGKGLSENDFTDVHSAKLSGIEAGAEVNIIEKVRVDGAEIEVSDYDRSVNLELQERYVLREEGKVLSTNDYGDHDASKLGGIEYGAQVNVQSDWNESSSFSDAYIRNKPVVDTDYNSTSTNAQSGTAVAQAIAEMVNGSPEALDTLYELAKALGNDPDFAATVMDAIGKKVDKIDSYGLAELLTYPDHHVILVDKGNGHTTWASFYGKSQSEILLNGKVDKEDGKVLSSNDFTSEEKEKLGGIDMSLKADKQNSRGGFEGGNNASSTNGGAVGNNAFATNGGAIGNNASTKYGGAVGNNASTNSGGAVGYGTSAGGGGAVGYDAFAGEGFSGGNCARVDRDETDEPIDAIQLGSGVNHNPKTLQIYTYTLMNADGTIPAERMAVKPITAIPEILATNTSYNFAEIPAKIEFPTVANDGDVIYLTFMVGDEEPTIEFITTNTSDYELVPEANTGYEIYAKFNGSIWIVGYSEYTVPGGETV